MVVCSKIDVKLPSTFGGDARVNRSRDGLDIIRESDQLWKSIEQRVGRFDATAVYS
jgi:hypothetical protein